MVDPAIAISGSGSPHCLWKINSPYSTSAVFTNNDETNTQVNTLDFVKSNSNNNLLSTRHSSFSFSNGRLNFYSKSSDTISRLPIEVPESKVGQLIATYSNNSLYKGSTASLTVPSFRSALTVPKFGRSQSMVIDSQLSESTLHSKLRTLSEAPNSHGNLNSIPHETKGRSQGLKAEPKSDGSSPTLNISKSQPALFKVQIGPIARKNFREYSTEKEESILQVSQLFVPDKSWVRATQGISGEVPTLDLDPFSPYSPGFSSLNADTLDITGQNSTLNEPIDLNEYCKRVDILPREEDDESDDDNEVDDEANEEFEVKEVRKSVLSSGGHEQHNLNQSQTSLKDLDNDQESIDFTMRECDETVDRCLIGCRDELAEELEGLKTEGVDDDEDEEENVVVQEHNDPTKVTRENTLSSYEIDFALETSTWELIYRHGQDPIDAAVPTIASTHVSKSSNSSESKSSSEHEITVDTVNEPTATAPADEQPMEAPTESEFIANQWRRNQSNELSAQQRNNVEHSIRSDPFAGSQLLERRYGKRSGQQKFNSTGSLPGTRKQTNDSTLYCPLTTSTTRFKSQSGDLVTTTYEDSASMSDDTASTPTQSISTVMSNDISSQNDQLEPPASSSDSESSVEYQERRLAKIDTKLPRLAMSSKYSEAGPQSQMSESPADKEQVVASKVWRSGKLFAKKIKTIAVFEYNTAKKLGKGNFGIVYQGKKIDENFEVAIKKITRKLPGEIEKLGLVQREMKVCRLFNNRTGIVPLLDIITTNKHHYLVFEKAESDLAEMLRVRCKDAIGRRSGTDLNKQPTSPSCSLGSIFNINEIRSIMYTVVVGTQALHKEGYSHKDIKPANILYSRGRGMLCDFGLCSQNEELPQNQFFGTQDYASPEARRAGCNRGCNYIQSDVYSLGAVLYELTTGSVLSKVISQGLNWQRIANFGGRDFSELLQGMVNDIEKRWDIDQVVNSPFWTDSMSGLFSPTRSAFTMNTVPRRKSMPAELGPSADLLTPTSLA